MNQLIRTGAFILWLLVTGYNLYIELRPDGVVSVPVKLFFAAGFVLLWTIVFPPNRKHMGKWLSVLFLYYIWMLLDLLFFDAAFGRAEVQTGINLKPFYTIRNYMKAYRRGYIPEIALMNLWGNVAVFAPMGFFLPSLFGLMRRFWAYCLTLAGMILTVEGIQVWLNCGSGDMDDFILNLTGAVISWIICFPLSKRVYKRLRRNKK